MAQKIVIIGGSAAGPKAAARARRLDQDAEITIIEKGPDLSMASCGYPYFVGGVFDDRNELLSTPTGVVRDPMFFFNAKNITAKTRTEAVAIDRTNKAVKCRNIETGEEFTQSYDKLILAMGSTPVIPPVPGADLDGITTLQSMRDADYLRKIRDDKKIEKAIIVGGGLIGIETMEALHLAGIKVTLIEMLPQIMKFLDPELAKGLEKYISSQNVDIITENGVSEFLGKDGKLTGVKLQNGTELPTDLAVVAVGVRPNSKLAQDSDIEVGNLRGIKVDDFMQTNDADIYAVGDCCEITNRISGEKCLAPYGDLANIQGRIAGENAIRGNNSVFKGTIQTGICKIFAYSAGATGLSEQSARALGMDIETAICAGPDKPHFMDAKLIISKMVADKKTGRVIGFQAFGPGDVSKRVAEAAMAIQGNMTVSDLVTADLPYAPPFSPALDNLITTAQVLENKLSGLMTGISSFDVKQKLDNQEKVFYLDLRGPDEYEAMRLGIGETLIPLGALRKRIAELPEDKEQEIVCFCKISLRGYEGARILQAAGYKNVKVLEGGIMSWPFAREK